MRRNISVHRRVGTAGDERQRPGGEDRCEHCAVFRRDQQPERKNDDRREQSALRHRNVKREAVVEERH